MSRERSGGRGAADLRPTTIQPGFVETATGSALIACGGTRVICTASVQESVPRWMYGEGRGWLRKGGCGDAEGRDGGAEVLMHVSLAFGPAEGRPV